MNFVLTDLDKTARHFLAAFLFLITIATTVGLFYIYETTSMTKDGVNARYNGSTITDEEFDIPDQYPKSIQDLLLNTHNHLFGFAIIFFLVGGLFYFNSTINGRWKYFLIVEPFISVFITFTFLWFLRFAHTAFVYIVFIAGVLTYLSLYLMISILVYELIIKTYQR